MYSINDGDIPPEIHNSKCAQIKGIMQDYIISRFDLPIYAAVVNYSSIK